MKSSILVTYATKHGSTAEIAEKIGQVIRERGFNVDVLPVEQVQNITSYQSVVVGSAVYAGQWRQEAATFLEKSESALAERPVWLFSSGPTGDGEPEQLMNGWKFPGTLQPIANRIQPRDITFFHGVLDTEKLGFAEKLIVKGLKAPTGDYRDWEVITSWAEDIAHDLKQNAN